KQVVDHEPVPPRALDASIPRDLDTIVLKCLEKNPERRYQAARELADDIERFLSHRPILARRSTRPERALRWCRRNPVVASLTGIVALLLVSAVAILALGNARIRSESEARAAALAQRDRSLGAARSGLTNLVEILLQISRAQSRVPQAAYLQKLSGKEMLPRLEQLLKEWEDLDLENGGEQGLALMSIICQLQEEAGQVEDSLRSALRAVDVARRIVEADPSKDGQFEAEFEMARHLGNASGGGLFFYPPPSNTDPNSEVFKAARLATLEALRAEERRAAVAGRLPKVTTFYTALSKTSQP